MARPDLLAVGEAFEDLIFHGLARLPRPGEELKTSDFTRGVGGGAVITAIAAARLGLRTAVLSGLAPPATALLKREGVAFRNLRQEREPAALSVALSTPKNRSFVTFTGMNEALEERLRAEVPHRSARHVHFAFSPRECRPWVALVRDLGRRSVSTSWSFGWNEALLRDTSFLPLLGALDYLMMNDEEALFYSKRRTVKAALDYFKGRTGNLIVTLGRRGARWVCADSNYYSPARPVKVLDTTGAGDAFNGGFLYGVLKGLPPKRCLELGNGVGALSTRAPGGIDGLPRLNEIS